MSEYLSEEEQVDRLKSWWGENGTSVMVAVAVAVVGIVGWQWYGSHSEEQVFNASRAYSNYTQAAQADKSAAAEQLAEAHAGSAYHVFALFDQAQDALAGGDLAKAEGFLSEAIELGDDALLVDLARVRLAKIQQALDRSAQALKTLESVSNEGYRAWALEAKGDIHVSRGELQLAYAAYQAAMESLAEGEQRPLLEMKLNNVAPFEGEHVQFADTLESALQAAQETLETTRTAEETALEAVNNALSDVQQEVEDAQATPAEELAEEDDNVDE